MRRRRHVTGRVSEAVQPRVGIVAHAFRKLTMNTGGNRGLAPTMWLVVPFFALAGLFNVCLAAPPGPLPDDLDLAIPLILETGYASVDAGELVRFGHGVVQLRGLQERGYPHNSLAVLYHDGSEWVRPRQHISAPADYPGPYFDNGAVCFMVAQSIPPLTTTEAYVLISAAPARLARFRSLGEAIDMSTLWCLRNTPPLAEGWVVQSTEAAALLIGGNEPSEAETESLFVALGYDGRGYTSSAMAFSRPIPVTAGDRVSWKAVYRLAQFPVFSMDTLAGAGVIRNPGDGEIRNPGVQWGIRFVNGQGGRVEGPGFWAFLDEEMPYPMETGSSLTVPDGAISMQLTLLFHGRAQIRLEILDVVLERCPPAPEAREYSLYECGKACFPQIEARVSGPAISAPIQPEVYLAPSLRSLDGDHRSAVFDGIAFLNPVFRSEGPANACPIVAALTEDGLPLPAAAVSSPVLAAQAASLPAEGYMLCLAPDRTHVVGRDLPGLFYGLQELGERWRLGNGQTTGAVVLDWPTLPVRMVHHFRYWTKIDDPRGYYERWIPKLARSRINAIACDERLAWYHMDDAARQEWQWLETLCRRWQIDLVPMGYNFRNPMPDPGPNLVQWIAAKWVENEPYTLEDTRPVELKRKPDAYRSPVTAPENLGLVPDAHGLLPTIPLLGASNPFRVTCEDGSTLYVRDQDYVVDGEFTFYDTNNRLPGWGLKLVKPFCLRRTGSSAIPSGGSVRVSYNYVYMQRGGHRDDFSTCISEPEAIRYTKDALKETLAVLEPRAIHLNQDEVVGIGRDGRDILRMRADGRTPGQLFADLLNGFRDTVREAGSRATLLVWDDGLTPLHGGWSRNYNAPHYPFDALDYLSPADFTICVWRYGYGSGATSSHFLERGFPVIGCCTESVPSITDWCFELAGRTRSHPGKSRGVFMTIWKSPNATAFLNHRLLARLAWNPAPWLQIDNDTVYLFDPYYKPASLDVDGRGLALKPAAVPAGAWPAWRTGYCAAAALPPGMPDGAIITAHNARAGVSQTVYGNSRGSGASSTQ